MTHAEWQQFSARLSPPTKAFIDGRQVAAASGETFASVNPSTGSLIAEISSCDSADVDLAVTAARRAFESRAWSRMPPRERKKRLIRFADLIDKHSGELACLETLDVGKPISDSLSVDLPLTANCIRWYGEAIDKIYDEIAPTAPSAISLMRREPLGVVAAVVPWNFPLLMAAWKIGPVLAAGNSLVLKPAEQSPFTALRLAELAIEADIPPGVFNVVPGYGERAGKALGMHMDVDAVTFTGSTEVGKLFMTYSGHSNLKRVSLECGGKSPNIVLADAPDLDAAAKAACWGIFYNQGEVCNAGSRLIVERSIHDEFLEKVLRVARGIRMGDPLNPDTQMGPVVDATQMQRVLGYIESGREQGATLRLGGAPAAGGAGYFIPPTLFDHVESRMTVAQEEIFGPVLSVLAADDVNDALRIGNDTIYGLAAAVWTRDINKAFKAANTLKAGVVWVNCFDEGDISSPFGGFKQSGFGRDKSLHAIEKYSDIKTIWIHVDE